MVKWEIATRDLTAIELEALAQFWKGGIERAVGFNFNTAQPDNRAYQTPTTRRPLGRRIVKATKKEEGD